jgi:hypothetical protein
MLHCTICGERFRPPWASLMTEDDAVCQPCFTANLSGNPLEEERPPPLPLPLTPRQVEAMRRVAEAWQREREGS